VNEVDFDEIRSWMQECGAIARTHFNHVVGRRKADRSWVTEADVAIERVLVERIGRRYPNHGIIGEEQTRSETGREYLWALDPIDGTAAFVAGLPTWGISVGLLYQGAPHLGMIFFPVLDDYYWAGPSGDAFLNGRPIRVLAPRDWEGQDWIATPSNAHRRFTIDFAGKTRSLGSTVASFCYVARGSAVGGLITRAAIWDIAAGLAILRAAGGVAIGMSGASLEPSSMRDGQPIPEPALLGEQTHVRALQAVIHERSVQ
jgi:myo-inositol-1(or 4)-monophosphatase